MQKSFISIPFKIEGEHGISKIEGLAKFSQAGIVLEFEKKFLGLFETGVKEVGIPLVEIESVRFKKGFLKFGAKIEIRVNNLAKLSDLPTRNSRLLLAVARIDHAEAENAVVALEDFLNKTNNPPQNKPRPLFDESEDETKKLDAGS